ncbi:MAG: glycosyltransferase family 2 protein, partial [Sphingobacteriales bacterium]|nr:glycosyltransferase family 2 protein [Sphingobacteriales bacterium]
MENAITSVLIQSDSNWEIIIVDDGSTDNFEHIIKTYATDPRMKIFRNEKNMGCGYTKRKCVEHASGNIMGFLDPDDALTPDAITIMKEAHAIKPSHSIIHSTHYICDDVMHTKRIAEYPRAIPQGIPYLLLNDGRIHHFATFKKAHYNRTQGINATNIKAIDQDL